MAFETQYQQHMATLNFNRTAGYLKIINFFTLNNMSDESLDQLNACETCKELRLEYELSVQQHLQFRKQLGLLDRGGLVELARRQRAEARFRMREHGRNGHRHEQLAGTWQVIV